MDLDRSMEVEVLEEIASDNMPDERPDWDRAQRELVQLAAAGLLHPRDVVTFAKDETTALHAYFEWDDSEAAERYRIAQARTVISRVKVVIPSVDGQEIRVRAYESLASDRKNGGGYRAVTPVMTDVELRAEMLATAMAELSAFRRRYQHLKELAAVMSAIEKVAA